MMNECREDRIILCDREINIVGLVGTTMYEIGLLSSCEFGVTG
jgi:hypothetical protein